MTKFHMPRIVLDPDGHAVLPARRGHRLRGNPCGHGYGVQRGPHGRPGSAPSPQDPTGILWFTETSHRRKSGLITPAGVGYGVQRRASRRVASRSASRRAPTATCGSPSPGSDSNRAHHASRRRDGVLGWHHGRTPACARSRAGPTATCGSPRRSAIGSDASRPLAWSPSSRAGITAASQPYGHCCRGRTAISGSRSEAGSRIGRIRHCGCGHGVHDWHLGGVQRREASPRGYRRRHVVRRIGRRSDRVAHHLRRSHRSRLQSSCVTPGSVPAGHCGWA